MVWPMCPGTPNLWGPALPTPTPLHSNEKLSAQVSTSWIWEPCAKKLSNSEISSKIRGIAKRLFCVWTGWPYVSTCYIHIHSLTVTQNVPSKLRPISGDNWQPYGRTSEIYYHMLSAGSKARSVWQFYDVTLGRHRLVFLTIWSSKITIWRWQEAHLFWMEDKPAALKLNLRRETQNNQRRW